MAAERDGEKQVELDVDGEGEMDEARENGRREGRG